MRIWVCNTALQGDVEKKFMTKQTPVIGAGTSTRTDVGSVGELMMIIRSYEIGKAEYRYRSHFLSKRNEFLLPGSGGRFS